MDSEKQFETQAHVMQASNALRDALMNLNSWEKQMKQKEKQKTNTVIEVSFINDFLCLVILDFSDKKN